MNTVTLIKGDGIGPEITEATIKVIEAAGARIKWEEVSAGESALKKFNTPLPAEVIESLQQTGVGLKGPLTTPVGSGYRSINVALRKELDLYANLRPAKTYRGLTTPFENVDLVVIRENTEDLYTGIEHMVGDDAAESIKIITRKASERICRYAFRYAQNADRKKVTVVHKANIMKLTDGLFLESARKVSEEYPEVEFEDCIVDNMAMQLVMKPWQYEVMVMPNLYGDILSELCAGLVGGLGIVPGANIGEQAALFEPVHGSVPKYAGQNRANPAAMIMASVLMLGYIGENEAAWRIEQALSDLIEEGREITPDLGGSAGTREMAQALATRVR